MNGESPDTRKLPRATKAEDEPNLRGLKPSEPFFMVVSVANLDGIAEPKRPPR